MSADLFFDPFVDFAFMRRALAAALALSLGGAPLGVFLMLRRMTLAGDALAHAVLPGVAAAALAAGLSLWAMTLGGMATALALGVGTVFLTQRTALKEDGALALLYLLSLAAGVTLISLKGRGINLLHILFGNILAVDGAGLGLVVGAACVSLLGVAVFFRRFVVEGFDPAFPGVVAGRKSGWGSAVFFSLLVVNLVAAFQAMGTLMALGMVILPALAARFWSYRLDVLLGLSVLFALLGAWAGLLFSFHAGVPSGPAIVLVLGFWGLFSALVGPVGGLRAQD